MTLNDITENIFVINLVRRPDRAMHIAEQAAKFNFRYTLVAATDANEINNPTFLRNGEHALLLSHARILQWAVNQNLDKIIILEDDCYFQDNLNERLEEIKEVPDDWEVIMLSGNHYYLGAGTIQPEHVSNSIMRVFSSFTTHALVIKSCVFDSILSAIYSFDRPLDIVYKDAVQSKGKMYSPIKSLGGQVDSFSDIIGFQPSYNAGGIYD